MHYYPPSSCTYSYRALHQSNDLFCYKSTISLLHPPSLSARIGAEILIHFLK